MRHWSVLSALLLLSACGRNADLRERATLTASVAASLQNAMEALAPEFERLRPEVRLNFNFGGSGTLAQQIEHGAPADAFISAAPKPMDALESKGLLMSGTRRDLLRNRIVLIAPKNTTTPNSFHDLASGAVKLIALGDPDSVPAGDYGRQVLQAMHVWDQVQSRLVLAKDVRQVLSYVETGNAEAGIVYETDARESNAVRIAATAPEDSHRPVIYPAAVIQGSKNADAARAFLEFLGGQTARDVFARLGFTPASP
jgi:molybdate transport system substrate-binding protein